MPSGWTPTRVLRRALEVLRADGPVTLAYKLLGETVYRRMTWHVRPLDTLPPLGDAQNLDYGFLTPGEAPAYLRLRPDLAREQVEERLRRGDRCFVVRDGGEVVAGHWVATGCARIDYLERELPLQPGDAYLYETFTAPAYRGRGLPAAAARRLAHALAAEGQRRIVGAVVPENRAARGAFAKTSYREAGRIGYVRLGPWRRHFTRIRE